MPTKTNADNSSTTVQDTSSQLEFIKQLIDSTRKNGNGSSKIWGLTVKDWSTLIGSVGVPSVFLGAIIYVSGWVIAPPLVQSITNLLDKTAIATTRMADQSERIQRSLSEISEIEKQSKVFMETVHTEHMAAQKSLDNNSSKLDTVIECVKDK